MKSLGLCHENAQDKEDCWVRGNWLTQAYLENRI